MKMEKNRERKWTRQGIKTVKWKKNFDVSSLVAFTWGSKCANKKVAQRATVKHCKNPPVIMKLQN